MSKSTSEPNWKLFLICTGLVFLGFGVVANYTSWRESKAFNDALKDPGKPPVLSAVQRDPKWNIGVFLGAGKKSYDCVSADDLMDQNAISKTVTRRGRSRTVYTEDYVKSCRSTFDSMVGVLRPQALKWCAYRSTDARLEALCQEWETKLPEYRARYDAANGPTLRRYEAFMARGS